MSMLFFGKAGNGSCRQAIEFAQLHFDDVIVGEATRGEPFPTELERWSGDYIVSYLCPWVIPASLLDRAREAAINFHPGPPEYPGVGCTNFAIYKEEPTFGVTCHHMAPAVDSGPIISVRRFPLHPTDTVLSLTHRCYAYLLAVFYDVMSEVVLHRSLPASPETWRRQPYRRAELDALCEVTPAMSEGEIRRRVRAVTYPGMPGAYTWVNGEKVPYPADEWQR
jgi:methionyl-tRNA formyltransferase